MSTIRQRMNGAAVPAEGETVSPASTSPPALDYHDVCSWTIVDVSLWLRERGYADYVDLFERNKIDGAVLVTLDEEDLKRPPMSIGVLGDVRHLADEICQLCTATGLPLPIPFETTHIGAETIRQSKLPLVRPGSFIKLAATDERWSSSWPKFFFSIAYLVVVGFITAVTMAIVHDRVPNSDKYPPLPDIVLDNIERIPWAFEVAEAIILVLASVFAMICLLHRYRMLVLRRACAIAGTVFLLRCLCMFVTSLSVPGIHLKCNFKIGSSIEDKLRHAWYIASGLGLSIKGVRTCGDYMFSGHTVVLTLLNMCITEYTPADWRGLHTLSWMANFFGMFFVLAAHEHYSIDVLIGFYISSRLFLYYHSLANSLALRKAAAVGAGGHAQLAKMRSYFPMFSYLEENIHGVVPNEYEWPWTAIARHYGWAKKRFNYHQKSAAHSRRRRTTRSA